MTERVPDDVMAAAKVVHENVCDPDRCAIDAGCGCLERIARAILAERERAAQIADRRIKVCQEANPDMDDGYWVGAASSADLIAKSIRGES